MDAAQQFDGKTLLITGGTGSFGNAVLRRFLHTGVKQIRILSRDEKKQDDMRHEYRNSKLKFHIGDVRCPESLVDAMEGVDYLFHAAALKQVPSCELYPLEAVRTNVMGTDNVLSAAIRAGVSKIVVLSTDKAAYPINAMGMSKALMEKITLARAPVAAQKGTTLAVTRYGNVMASRGSVIPLFVDQIHSGKPITVTDPNMTRFMMSLEDAVDLVLYAYTNATAGDLFVQKAPAATIATIAEAVRRIFAPSHPITCIGTRRGEKIYETLLTREEMVRASDKGSYFRVRGENRELGCEPYVSEGETGLSEMSDYHSHNVRRLDVEQTVELLLGLSYVQGALERSRSLPMSPAADAPVGQRRRTAA